MQRRVPSLEKIMRCIGYRPATTLDDLLESVIRDTCEQMGRPVPEKLAAAGRSAPAGPQVAHAATEHRGC